MLHAFPGRQQSRARSNSFDEEEGSEVKRRLELGDAFASVGAGGKKRARSASESDAEGHEGEGGEQHTPVKRARQMHPAEIEDKSEFFIACVTIYATPPDNIHICLSCRERVQEA
ncbi:MAG TPA: hypothetical protein V6C97_16100 [Oculatellaceae cyanobacterium]